ncbi:iron ABC transporter [Microbacterium sorbitolivorans]|uniref:Iron ABC transporter permease n=1 Tax=Microbacterium sorbitolivorans TaxID=1867410 RepID=A0A367Y293_9MICO|nr:iron ABC transporter permease [Microbacterium sorbitolivorans]RCK59974.1 iron ABC transporter permease [Microbacterium sorbitolivorans]GGF41571.1 iron ABC transporter [Microbacterium sorbitolivorans]
MRLKPRASVALAIAIASLVLLAVATVAMSVGDRPTAPADLVRALFGSGEENVIYAVREVRLPRVVLALVVGAAFGIAGGLSQGVLRNPLASPDVLGVSAGASVAAVGVMAIGSLGGPIGIVPIPVAALLGGFGAAALIALLGFGVGFRGRSLLLAGIALSTALTGITQYLLTRMDVSGAQSAAAWLTGSLNARGWADALPVIVGVAIVVPIVLILGHSARALIFEDDLTRNWGINGSVVRVALLACSVSLAALATSAGGPIGFVALVSGQVARRAARVADIPPILSGLIGAIIVLVADTAARTVFPVQLPVGVLTAIVGAPYLLYLLQRPRRGKGAL